LFTGISGGSIEIACAVGGKRVIDGVGLPGLWLGAVVDDVLNDNKAVQTLRKLE
jgi:hypothetical protein